MFNGANSYANSVDSALLYIIAISVFLLLGITGFMIYFAIRYSRKRHPNPIQTHGNTALEIVWIVVPTIIVISMFFVGIADYGVLRSTAKYDNLVKVTGFQWGWKFKYSNGFETSNQQSPDLPKEASGKDYVAKTNTYIPDTLFIPVNKVTKVEVGSTDVLHSFYIPAFRLKEDAVPKKNTFIILKPEKEGIYDIACAEYCGVKHSRMYSRLVVLSQEKFAEFLTRTAVKEEVKADASSEKKDEGSHEEKKH